MVLFCACSGAKERQPERKRAHAKKNKNCGFHAFICVAGYKLVVLLLGDFAGKKKIKKRARMHGVQSPCACALAGCARKFVLLAPLRLRLRLQRAWGSLRHRQAGCSRRRACLRSLPLSLWVRHCPLCSQLRLSHSRNLQA